MMSLPVLEAKRIDHDIYQDIKNYGLGSLAYAALQAGAKEFRHPAFKGFIAYFTVWGIDYVLSDPITPAEDFMAATLLFLNHSPSVVFCQVSEKYAKLLKSLDFTINGFGVEHILHLDDFEVGWKKRKRLKAYLSSLPKKGFAVDEDQPAEADLQRVNDQWLALKSRGRELRFMARPFVSTNEVSVRYFFLYQGYELLGFCSFDPVYGEESQGAVVAYALQHLRVGDLAPSGAADFMILKAIERFKQEGIERVSLGIAPLTQRDSAGFKASRWVEVVFSMLYEAGLFYPYRNLGEHKDQYKAVKTQVYLAAKDGFSLKSLAGLLKVNNLI